MRKTVGRILCVVALLGHTGAARAFDPRRDSTALADMTPQGQQNVQRLNGTVAAMLKEFGKHAVFSDVPYFQEAQKRLPAAGLTIGSARKGEWIVGYGEPKAEGKKVSGHFFRALGAEDGSAYRGAGWMDQQFYHSLTVHRGDNTGACFYDLVRGGSTGGMKLCITPKGKGAELTMEIRDGMLARPTVYRQQIDSNPLAPSTPRRRARGSRFGWPKLWGKR